MLTKGHLLHMCVCCTLCQGASILGALLFVVYLNDLPHIITDTGTYALLIFLQLKHTSPHICMENCAGHCRCQLYQNRKIYLELVYQYYLSSVGTYIIMNLV